MTPGCGHAVVATAPDPPGMPPEPPSKRARLAGPSKFISLLCVVLVGSLLHPLFLVNQHGSLPQQLVLAGSPRADSLRVATRISQGMEGIDPEAESFQCAGISYGEHGLHLCRCYVLPLLSSAEDVLVLDGFRVATWDDIRGDPLMEFACASAHYIVPSMAQRTVLHGQLWDRPSTSEVDWGPPSLKVTPTTLESDGVYSGRMAALHEQTDIALVEWLRTISGNNPISAYLRRPHDDSSHLHMTMLPLPLAMLRRRPRGFHGRGRVDSRTTGPGTMAKSWSRGRLPPCSSGLRSMLPTCRP